MIGIFFFVMLIYVYSYFAWACYLTTGYKLFDLKPIVHEIKKKLKKNEANEIDFKELKDLIK